MTSRAMRSPAWRRTIVAAVVVAGMAAGTVLAVPIKGDVTLDGVVDSRDVLLLQRYLKGEVTSLTADQLDAANVAPIFDCGASVGDTAVDTADLTILLRGVSGADVDGDAVTAAIENRMAVEYASQVAPCGTSPFKPPACFFGFPDADNDGLRLPAELTFGTNPSVADTDGDGLPDGIDSQGLGKSRDPECVGCIPPYCLIAKCYPNDPQFQPLSNPLVSDTDGDSISDGNEDFDQDGLSNVTELGNGTNINVADTDRDGLTDAFEVNTFGTDPKSLDTNCDQVLDREIDSDGDGLGYAEEVGLGTNPFQLDSDGDGVHDGQEIALCTNPLVADASGTVLCVNQLPDATMDWKLFQREASGSAFVPVQVHYRSSVAVTLQARVVRTSTLVVLSGHDFTDHPPVTLPAAPSGPGAAAFIGIPGVATGGNYNVDVRIVPTAGGAALAQRTITSIAVGDVFLAAGQSNMSGWTSFQVAQEPKETSTELVHNFANDWVWKLAEEPIDEPLNAVDPVSNNDILVVNSPMLRFAKEVSAGLGNVPVAIVPGPQGGAHLVSRCGGFGSGYALGWKPREDSDDWDACGATPPLTHCENFALGDPDARLVRHSLYGSAVRRVLAQGYRTAQGNPVPIRGVIYYQGEADTSRTTAEYKTHLGILVSYLRTDLGNPSLFFANAQLSTVAAPVPRECDTTVSESRDGWVGIQEAQRQYALENPLLSAAVALADVPNDGVHLLVSSQKEAGRRLAVATLRGSYGLNPTAQLGPRLVSVAFVAGQPTKVEINYDKAVSGGDATLYRLRKPDNALIPVTTVTSSGTKVTVQAASTISVGTTLSYGYGHESAPVPPPPRPPEHHAWIVAIDGSGGALAFKNVAIQ